MALVCFLHSMFGCAFVVRMSRAFRDRGVIDESRVTKIGTALLVGVCFAQFALRASPVAHALSNVSIVLIGFSLFVYVERAGVRNLRARIPLLLDRWILNMKLGQSVSAARDAALREEEERFRNLMRPLFDTRAAGRPEHLLLSASVRFELENIGPATPAPLARLVALRRAIRNASEFRRKSGQAIRQTTIQAAVMLVLLLAMVVFTIQRYGWSRTGDLVTISTLLSLIGVGLMFRLAKKTRWKL